MIYKDFKTRDFELDSFTELKEGQHGWIIENQGKIANILQSSFYPLLSFLFWLRGCSGVYSLGNAFTQIKQLDSKHI